jgi:3-oxoacyl-[acyl-carrier-protein] synthase II
MRRVVVTGLGLISPLGCSKETVWDSLRAGRQCIAPVSVFDASPFRAGLAAELRDFDPSRWFPPHRLKRLDRFAQFAVASALEAWTDAGFPMRGSEDPLRSDVGISCGSALGGFSQAEAHHVRFLQRGAGAIPPALGFQVFGGAGHSQIAIQLGISGYATTNANSCASGTAAIGEAWRAVREGLCDVALAVGADAPLAPLTFGAFDAIHTMDPRGYYSFDKRRAGFVMGEGGACLICESLEHALARRATIYCEIAGYALTNDAYHMTSTRPDHGTVLDCVRKAMRSAEVGAEDIDWVNAHASGTQMNDAMETAVLHEIMGSRAKDIIVSGTKPYHGHGLGAAGAMETAIACLVFQRGWIPGVPPIIEPDPVCDLFYGDAGGCSLFPRSVLKLSFGFGGINAALILRALEGDGSRKN